MMEKLRSEHELLDRLAFVDRTDTRSRLSDGEVVSSHEFDARAYRYATFNFATTAWHLFSDWIRKRGNPTQLARRSAVQNEARRLLNIWFDFASASKHVVLSYRATVGSHSEPLVGDWQAFFLGEKHIYVTIGNQTCRVADLTAVTVEVLNWVLDGTGDDMPHELTEHVSRALRTVMG